MTQTSRPWQSTTPGDAGPYSASNWHQLYQHIIGLGGLRANIGVFLGSGIPPNEGLRVQEQSPVSSSIDILSGAALVQGLAYINTTTESFVIAANASGNPRIDTVVVRADYALQTARLTVIQGTPAASPSPPALTQSAGIMWDIPLADIAVADSFTTITNANITPRYEWANAAPGVYLDGILNNSGVTLEDGDVVVWDNTAARAVTTTTTADDKQAAGVWRGRTAAAGYGRVQTKGIGYIRTNAATAIGDSLATSTTARQAAINNNSLINKRLGRALEITSGAGLALADIDVQYLAGRNFVLIRDEKATNTAPASITSGGWRVRELNTEVIDTAGIASLPGSNRIRLEAGTYSVWAACPSANTTVGNAARLFNFSDTAVLLESSHGNYAALSLTGRFTITAQKDLELQHWVAATVNGGTALNTGSNEIYAAIMFERLPDIP